jgi:hypothetical protein
LAGLKSRKKELLMADEETTTKETGADGAEASAEASGGKDKNASGALGRRAKRSLRRARAAYEGNEWQESNEASFLIQEANVLALMDLAEAVREQGSNGSDDG